MASSNAERACGLTSASIVGAGAVASGAAKAPPVGAPAGSRVLGDFHRRREVALRVTRRRSETVAPSAVHSAFLGICSGPARESRFPPARGRRLELRPLVRTAARVVSDDFNRRGVLVDVDAARVNFQALTRTVSFSTLCATTSRGLTLLAEFAKALALSLRRWSARPASTRSRAARRQVTPGPCAR